MAPAATASSTSTTMPIRFNTACDRRRTRCSSSFGGRPPALDEAADRNEPPAGRKADEREQQQAPQTRHGSHGEPEALWLAYPAGLKAVRVAPEEHAARNGGEDGNGQDLHGQGDWFHMALARPHGSSEGRVSRLGEPSSEPLSEPLSRPSDRSHHDQIRPPEPTWTVWVAMPSIRYALPNQFPKCSSSTTDE